MSEIEDKLWDQLYDAVEVIRSLRAKLQTVDSDLRMDNSRLRAELAAEKERAADMPIVLVDVLLSERERCARIVESELPQFSWEPEHAVLTAIAAAIRARNAAPPHVEPSAAESEPGRRIGVYVRRADQLRMLELAREMQRTLTMRDVEGSPARLAALVIETFGEKK